MPVTGVRRSILEELGMEETPPPPPPPIKKAWFEELKKAKPMEKRIERLN
ncbi:hypothetical protein MANES_06G123850v8 [Manihot esculenta]|uniref:Uncharacterized protein n=1 Tax=Manihot esculenta TaxID=3983 RepID=A0ACB7HIT7_MANES|nr:hypothetical protein MANES_06G123850v8 [Manihot esculenta]